MPGWDERLEDALTYLDESTFYEDHRKLEGDAMMVLSPLTGNNLNDETLDKLNKVDRTIDEFLNAIEDASVDAPQNQRQLLEAAHQSLSHVQSKIRSEKEPRYEAKDLGEITTETTVHPGNQTVKLRTRHKPHTLYKSLTPDEEIKEKLSNKDTAKTIATNIQDSIADLLENHDFLIKTTTTIDISFAATERIRASIEPRSTPQHIWLKIGVTPDLLDNNDLTNQAEQIIIHELTHFYDDAPRKEEDRLDYALLTKTLRQEGIPTFAEEALRQDHYEPTLDDITDDLRDELKPLPDDLHKARQDNKIETDQAILQYAESRAPYDLGKAMIDLIYLHRLTTNDKSDSKEQRIALLKELRNHDVNAFINAYKAARDHFDLNEDQIIQAHQIAKTKH